MSIPKNRGDGQVRRNPDSSSVIYLTASSTEKCKLMAENHQKQEESKKMSTHKNAARMASLLTKWADSFKKILDAKAATPSNTQDPNTKETKTSTLSAIFILLAETLK